MVVISIFQCLPYATVFVRCFLSTSSLILTMSLWECFPCFTNEEMVVQGGYVTLHSKILLASNQTWIWTNVFFLWRALHGFWVKSYFGIIRNGMEWRMLLLAMKPQVSLAFQAVFLKSVLEKQKAAEGRASHLHLKIRKKAIPWTLRNILGPAVFPRSPLLPSGAWALYTLLSLLPSLMLHIPKQAPLKPLVYIFSCLLVVIFFSMPAKRIGTYWVWTHFLPL